MKDNTWETERIAAQAERIDHLNDEVRHLKRRETFVFSALGVSILFLAIGFHNQSVWVERNAQDKVYADLYRNYGRIPNK